MKEKNKKDSMLIDWLLVALYFAVVLVLVASIYLRSDFLIPRNFDCVCIGHIFELFE